MRMVQLDDVQNMRLIVGTTEHAVILYISPNYYSEAYGCHWIIVVMNCPIINNYFVLQHQLHHAMLLQNLLDLYWL